MRERRLAALAVAVNIALLLVACAPTPTPIPPSPTSPPPTEALPSPTPTLVPISLAGPAGATEMKWFDGSTLVYIPAGDFSMGTGAGDAPVHNVTLDAYWVTRTEVTNAMYGQCVGTGSCTPPVQELGGEVYSNTAFSSHPITGVTWDQAQAYCTWIQGRLPTEAEWEKAARGAAGNPYPWGTADPTCDLLNFGTCLGRLTDVTSYADGASAYGLLGLAGNVFEWVADWYDEAYYGASPAANPTGPESGELRVVRGSSFESDPDQLESAIRHYAAPAFHNYDTGFRCVVPDPKPLAPYCQLAAYVPSGQAGSATCELPSAAFRGRYCASNFGYVTVDIPEGATYEVPERDFTCTEATVDGQRRLTCEGPRAREVTDEITVCNPACSGSPDVTGAVTACDSGYTLAPGTSACNYTPIVAQQGVPGCPAGYVNVTRGDQQMCALGTGEDGNCPPGLYLDSLYGACAPAAGGAEAPYGIDNADVAAQAYQGCLTGYTYDPLFQCCQASSPELYPGCAPGTTFDSTLGACSPGGVKQSGPGCVSLTVTIPDCGVPVDVCKRIDSEAQCIKAAYACKWLEAESRCVLK